MINRHFKFNNGDTVIEKVTGFRGVITGSVYYITGCNQYLVTAKAKDDSSEACSVWYDEGRLSYVGEGITTEEVYSEENGCDKQAPKK